jgi:hypothetical protein
MAKVKGPLHSEKASGKLGDVLLFVCGTYVKMQDAKNWSSGGEKEPTESQSEQQAKFEQGARLWSKTLTKLTKENWTAFKKILKTKDVCTAQLYLMSGYSLWQSYFCKFGVDGWLNYPDPPTLSD